MRRHGRRRGLGPVAFVALLAAAVVGFMFLRSLFTLRDVFGPHHSEDVSSKASDTTRDFEVGTAPRGDEASVLRHDSGASAGAASGASVTDPLLDDPELARLHRIVQQAYRDLEAALKRGDMSEVPRLRRIFDQADAAYRAHRRSLGG